MSTTPLTAYTSSSRTPSSSLANTFQSWTALSTDERLQCIGTISCIKTYGGMNAWPAAGCLRDRWNQDILDRTVDMLSYEENQRTLRGPFRPPSKVYRITPLLFMLSTTKVREQAVPYVVLQHKRVGIARRAIGVLRHDRTMQSFSFQYLAEPSRIKISGDKASSEVIPSEMHERTNGSLCGTPVLTCALPIDPSTMGRRATIGGVLKFGAQDYFALTSAHIFFNQYEPQEDSDDENAGPQIGAYDTPGDLSDSEDEPDNSEVVAERPPLHAIFQRPQPPSRTDRAEFSSNGRYFQPLGNASHLGNAFPSCAEHIGRFYNPSLDWALFKITDPRFWRPNVVQDGSVSLRPQLWSKSKMPPTGEVAVLTGSFGPVKGTSIGIKSSIPLPWSSTPVEAWPIDCDTGPGACGSWVVDVNTGLIHGIVIAHSPRSHLTWMLPAYKTFSDIMERWDGSYESVDTVFQISQPAPIAGLGPEGVRTPRQGDITSPSPERSVGTLTNVRLRRPYAESNADSAYHSGPLSALETMSKGSVEYSSSGFVLASMSHQPPKADQVALPSKSVFKFGLSDLAYDFVYNCPDDFGAWYRFMSDHPTILSEPPQSFVNAARQAQQQKHEKLARSCLQRAVLQQNFSSIVSRTLREYFEPLMGEKQEPEAIREFYKSLDVLLEGLKSQNPGQRSSAAD